MANTCHSEPKYVVLKVYVHSAERDHEVKIYDQINATQSDHLGKTYIRKLFNHFHIDGPHGRHTCLVHQTLGMSLDQYLCFFPGKVMTLNGLKPCIRQILGALDFLHDEARVIHTGKCLKPREIHLIR